MWKKNRFLRGFKQYPGNRKLSVIVIVFLIILALGLLLQGCGPGADTPIPEVLPINVEEGSESEEEPAQAADEVAAWCDPAEDFHAVLEDLGEFTSEEIQIEVCIPGGAGNYSLDTEIPDLEAYPPPVDGTEPFPIAVLIAYLRVLDSEENPVYTFDPDLIMRVIYSQGAWFDSIERQGEDSLERPRVAYLEWNGSGWVEPWIEFSSEISGFTAPDPANPESLGHLDIIIEELPDPLIGDC
jgi:hypothetical protein